MKIGSHIAPETDDKESWITLVAKMPVRLFR
jgi:hypothetical protein